MDPDDDGSVLPAWAEEYLATERRWHRLLRATGLVTRDEAVAALAQWMAS